MIVFVIFFGCVGIIDDFDNLKIIFVVNGKIIIFRDFLVFFGDWCSDSVRVYVLFSLGMYELDFIVVF